MSSIERRLATNLEHVHARIAVAAQRGRRPVDDVQLIAVTKYVDLDVACLLPKLGVCALGESRPQELWRKADALAEQVPPVQWHFIGHLQRNKLERTLRYNPLVHSGDSLRLLTAMNEFGQAHQKKVATLIEVNISGDATKHGFLPPEMPGLGEALAALTFVEVRGLMGMSSLTGTLDDARREFAALRTLRDQLRVAWPQRWQLTELSMGMSDDFEVAIEEGATMVRIGSALFEGVA